VKTQWERYCELRAIDNWLLRNPAKAYFLSIAGALIVFGLSRFLQFSLDWIGMQIQAAAR